MKTCPHGYIVDDPTPANLCPFCKQPNRAKIVKAWKERKARSVRGRG